MLTRMKTPTTFREPEKESEAQISNMSSVLRTVILQLYSSKMLCSPVSPNFDVCSLSLCLCACVYVVLCGCVWGHTGRNPYLEVRQQFFRVGSFFPSFFPLFIYLILFIYLFVYLYSLHPDQLQPSILSSQFPPHTPLPVLLFLFLRGEGSHGYQPTLAH